MQHMIQKLILFSQADMFVFVLLVVIVLVLQKNREMCMVR